MLIADSLYIANELHAIETGVLVNALWALQALLLGASGLHPSVTELARAEPVEERAPGRWRLTVLAMSSLLAPVLLLIHLRGGLEPQVGVPIGLASLTMFLLVFLRMGGLIRRILSQGAELARLSRTDSLTGIANRRHLDEYLAREIERAARSGEPLSLVLLDMDHFKGFNDVHGHPSGDALLREATTAWGTTLRAADLLARFGGEEFAVVLPDCGAEHALIAAERLRAAIPSGQTASAGVAVLLPGGSADSLLARADAALYAAKRAGRDRAVLAPAEPLSADAGTAGSVPAAG